jgi:hypothetical protein
VISPGPGGAAGALSTKILSSPPGFLRRIAFIGVPCFGLSLVLGDKTLRRTNEPYTPGEFVGMSPRAQKPPAGRVDRRKQGSPRQTHVFQGKMLRFAP